MRIIDYFVLRNLNKERTIKKVINRWVNLGCKHNEGLDKYALSVHNKTIQKIKLKIKRIK
jgi:hypothetical protein